LQPNGRSGGRFDRDGFPERAWQEILQLSQLYRKPRSKPARWATGALASAQVGVHYIISAHW